MAKDLVGTDLDGAVDYSRRITQTRSYNVSAQDVEQNFLMPSLNGNLPVSVFVTVQSGVIAYYSESASADNVLVNATVGGAIGNQFQLEGTTKIQVTTGNNYVHFMLNLDGLINFEFRYGE